MATLTIKPTVSAIRHTESGKSYWGNNGAYNEEYSRLYDELVPASGDAKTVHGELIRAISRLGYEYNNNGNCNAAEPYYADPEYDVDDDGEEYCINEDEIDHIDIAPYYDRMLNFIPRIYLIRNTRRKNNVTRRITTIIHDYSRQTTRVF